jgi:hypothetical protein
METLASDQLLRLIHIELRCVQEYCAVFPQTVPEAVCDLLCQHAEVAHQLSEQLWKDYHRTVHGHVPSTVPPSCQARCRCQREASPQLDESSKGDRPCPSYPQKPLPHLKT